MTAYISQNAFWGLLISAAEVYKRECFGLLIGYRDRRELKDMYIVEHAIPYQTATRGHKGVASNPRAHRRIERRASKKQTQTKPETWEYAKYVAVFATDLSSPVTTLLEWYRVRWQIELTFKRLKSLACLGQLPKHDHQSSRAWLYGKLFVALLTQKLIRTGREISPWGYTFSQRAAEQ